MPRSPRPPLYSTWASMLDRCRNTRNPCYKNYGGRGIYVCDRWQNFRLFESDMGPRPTAAHSLDRIDNDGPYSPENCRWATRAVQNRNKSDNRKVVFDGVEYLAVDLGKEAGLKPDTIIYRANQGLTFDEVMNPARRINSSGLANARIAMRKIREATTHCKKGHSLSDAIIDKNGWRLCRVCYYANMRKKAARRIERRLATAALEPPATA